MIILAWLFASPPSALAAELTYPGELLASASSASSPTVMTVDQVAFGNGYSFTTRGFNGGIPGPTLRMNPGETFYITLQNNLQASNDKPCTTTGGNFCEAATTNLHTHGLHVSSKGMENGLSYYSDDIFAMIEPGASAAYQFAIPSNHMGGTHWYHPHNHHATAIQAGGGAAGVLIVDDPVGYLPTEYSSMTEKVLFISGHNLVTLQNIATASQSTLMTSAATDAQNSNLDTNVFLVNGQIGPSMTVSSHAWYRLRMVYAAVEQTLELAITGDATCQTQLLAKDGIYLSTIPRAVTTIYLFPGARSDIALACTCQTYPCTGRLESNAGGGGGEGGGPPPPPPPPPPGGRRLQPMGGGGPGPGNAGGNVVTVPVMEIIVTDSGAASTPSLPATTLQRPCYLADLRSATVPNANTGTLALNGGGRVVTWNGQGNSMTYQAVHANAGTMSTWPALASFAVGSIYEIAVTGAGAHPLHLHINPFEITALDAAAGGGGYFQVGDWHDTLMLTAGGNQLTVRMNTDTFTGKMVIHCHILEHEDEGMMAWLDVTGSDGTTYSGNKQLDPTCYESDQQLSTFTSSTNSGGEESSLTTTTGYESSSTTSVSGSSPAPSTTTTSDEISSTTSVSGSSPAPSTTTTSDESSSTTSYSGSSPTPSTTTTGDESSSTTSVSGSSPAPSTTTTGDESSSTTSVSGSSPAPSTTTFGSTSSTASGGSGGGGADSTTPQATTTPYSGTAVINGNMQMTMAEDKIDAAIADPVFKDRIEESIAEKASVDKQHVDATLSKGSRRLTKSIQRRLAATLNVAYTMTLPASSFTAAQQQAARSSLTAVTSSSLQQTLSTKLDGTNYTVSVTSVTPPTMQTTHPSPSPSPTTTGSGSSPTPSSPTPSSLTPSTNSDALGAQDISSAETFTMCVVMSSLVVKLLA